MTDQNDPRNNSARQRAATQQRRGNPLREAWDMRPGFSAPRHIANLPWNVRDRVVLATQNRAMREGWRSGTTLITALAAPTAALVAMGVIFWLVGSLPQYAHLIMPVFLSMVFVTNLGMMWAGRRRNRRLMAQVLIEEGLRPAMCLVCSYDLTGTTSETCPECGQALAPVADADDAPST